MENEIQIQYTKEALDRMEILASKYKKEIEDSITKKKYVPGDKVIEITGSDIENAARFLSFEPEPCSHSSAHLSPVQSSRALISRGTYGIPSA